MIFVLKLFKNYGFVKTVTSSDQSWPGKSITRLVKEYIGHDVTGYRFDWSYIFFNGHKIFISPLY